MGKLIKCNAEQGLYVLQAGKGYVSCLGYEVAQTWAEGYIAWLKQEGQPAPALDMPPGTPEHYAQYEAAQSAVHAYHVKSGKRCPSQLTRALIGLENQRVEVTYPDGEKRRFWVGKSTGWIPVHLEIATTRSHGGGSVYFPEGSTVRVVSAARRR